MTWNAIWPIGSQSVKSNRIPGAQNTTYIETTMGNDIVGTNTDIVRDHFWDVGSDEDGRHRFINSPGFTVGGLPDDPVLGAGMNTVTYSKLKAVIESTVQQDVQLFMKNSEVPEQIMQLLGIRAMGVFNGSAATPAQAAVVYSHNLALQAAGTPGIVRTAKGFYTVTFATALLSNSYLVLGGAIRNDVLTGKDLQFNMNSSNTLTNVKSTTSFKFITKSISNSDFDPLQCWFVCFGG